MTKEGNIMSQKQKTIPVDNIFSQWRKDSDYMREFKSLEDEFALAQLFISARGAAGLAQQELAKKMHTSQAYIARLEGGKKTPQQEL